VQKPVQKKCCPLKKPVQKPVQKVCPSKKPVQKPVQKKCWVARRKCKCCR
jgi:hypothetical protein